MPFDLINSGKRFFDTIDRNQTARQIGGRLVNEGIQAEHTIKAQKEPQHSYRWEFFVRGMFGVDEDLHFYAQRTAIPTISQEVIRRRYCGKEYTFSGRESSPKIIRCTFYDNQELQIYRFFYKWMKQMNDPSTNRKVNPINYKKEVEIRLKDNTDGIITESFRFENCYPSEVTEAELDYSSSGILTFDVMFTYSDDVLGYGVVEGGRDINEIIGATNRIIGTAPGRSIINKASSYVRSFF